MRRYTITLGASTTAGGKVISASASGSINGVPIALENDVVFCPACKSQGKILCVGPRIPETWNGKQVALENDLCMCACPAPPKLVPNQTLRSQVIEDSPVSAGEASATYSSSDGRSDQASEGEIVEQFFSILDERGRPVEGFRYDLYKDGAIHTKAANYASGDTEKISGSGNLKLVTWFNVDGASRHG
ncbi:hypothetical protein RugamoR64_15370 [Duganella rhizosphaerae]|uniref:PAAR domain-containing protein n=1 Tax=Duganella rhizosphaerae TaxID=2885763 RepID=UPI0030E8ED89